jgi:hypothetical protein
MVRPTYWTRARRALGAADPKMAAPQKEPLEKLVLAGEQQLKDLVKPGNRPLPDVSKIITAGGAGAAKGAVDELDKWIGNAGTDGILNTAPYNFPRALGIKRAAPATASAPASQPGGG